MNIKKYPYIDSLRGFAILGVLATHSAMSAKPSSASLAHLMDQGANGVQLFFMVSAITLLMSWEKRASTGLFPILDFYLRRFFRIAPMFYLAIVLYLLLYGFYARYAAPNGLHSWIVLETALFIHGWHPESINSLVPGGWTIAVEMTFYAIFPFTVARFRSVYAIVAMFIGSLILFKLNNLFTPLLFHYPESQKYLVEGFVSRNFFGQLPVFLTGVIVYFLIKNKSNLTIIHCIAVILCIVTMNNLMSWWFPLAIGFSVFAFFLSVCPLAVFVNFFTVQLGKLSYSMYLLHFIVLYVFSITGISNSLNNSNAGSLLHLLLLIVSSSLVATGTLLLVENPGIRFGSLVINWISQKCKSD